MIVDPVVVFDVTVSRPVDLSDQAPGFLSGAAVGRSRTAPEVPAGSYRMAAAAPAGCGEALVMVADEVLIAGLWEWPPTTTVVGRVRYDKVSWLYRIADPRIPGRPWLAVRAYIEEAHAGGPLSVSPPRGQALSLVDAETLRPICRIPYDGEVDA